MEISVRPGEPAEFPFIVESIDREFIFSKGRSLSLSRRFPNVISDHNIEHILVAESNHSICGTVAIRLFDFATEQRVWRGAMIGVVWVDSQHRGKGIGRELMIAAERFLHVKSLDFGVLWTGIPTFYERSGWFLNDISLFGEASGCSLTLNKCSVICRSLALENVERLERVRSSLESQRVVRKPLDYQVVPLPAVEVNCFWASEKETEGYALAGEADGDGFLYEMVAPSESWDRLWCDLVRRFKRIFINEQTGTPFARWLADRKYSDLQPQNKTMWLRVSQSAAKAPLDTWYIPYFDRI
jgi:predicted N-acetyltransferase YhbS